ncbi:MAG: CBS domain-containing protein [Pseudomonadota bacterium]
MFSLYGLAGQNFRGTLEELGSLAGVSGARHSRGIAREGEEPLPTFVARVEGRPAAGHGGYEAAAQAYREMLQLEQERGPIYHAYQLMTREVLALEVDQPAAAAWRTLLARGVRQAPVLDAGHHLVGLVVERDLLTTFNLERREARTPLRHHVADVMISPVICADPVTDIRRIARAMLEFHLPGVPVVNETRALVGFVSRGDILRAVILDPPLSLWG